MRTVHVCSSAVAPAKPGHLRSVCGMCWFVHDNCKCYAVDDIGIVMRERDRRWSASRGMDLMDRQPVGCYRTRREAVAALREVAS
ncbi:MAG TPA: hypothetical protein DCQ64_26550 [Candidatus Rokubacteria bacterium]|nr:hypothetical protein [Candidatus Rokubacteria bacterium]